MSNSIGSIFINDIEIKVDKLIHFSLNGASPNTIVIHIEADEIENTISKIVNSKVDTGKNKLLIKNGDKVIIENNDVVNIFNEVSFNNGTKQFESKIVLESSVSFI